MDPVEILTLAREKLRREGRNQLARYEPYDFQLRLHAGGKDHPQRLLRAANQVGKCNTITTIIDTVDGPKTMGELYAAQQPFKVKAWDGEKVVEAWAEPPFKKPGKHPCYRVTMSDGRWFEPADQHFVLTTSGYMAVSELTQESERALLASTSAPSPSAHASDAPRSSRTPSGFQARCSEGLRRCGGRLLSGLENAVASFPSQAGVLPHTVVLSHEGGLVCTHTSTDRRVSDHPSSQYGGRRASDPCSGSSARTLCSAALSWICGRLGFPRRATEAPSRLLSSGAASLVRSSWGLLEIEGNHIISCDPIGLNEVYDFTVPGFENYVTAGVVHHNTRCGGREVAMHLTGRYPAWWVGKRFSGPVKIWAAGTTNEKTRDILQAELCGDPKDPDAWGTGAIPGETLGARNDAKRVYRKPGIPNALSAISVSHKNGGYSVLSFKAYEMGKEAFMGEGMDFIWLDEEPPEEIYTQCLARILRRRGAMMLTFTPENGATALVQAFETELKPGQMMVTASWDEAPHLNEKITLPDGTEVRMRDQILAALPAHEREMRSRGIPMLGSGLIFPIEQSRIEYDPKEMPSYFAAIGGLDFGIDHPTGFVKCHWDRDNDVFYVDWEYREQGPHIPLHASAIKKAFKGPVAWPHDGHRRDSGATEGIANEYRKEGVNMLPMHFTNPPTGGLKEGEGGISVEEGLIAMFQAMESGHFKVSKLCVRWLQEFRSYHRKDGLVVKINDDLMSATRYAYQMRRYAKAASVMKRQATAITEENPLEAAYGS